MSWRNRNNILYVHLSKADTVIHVDDFGIDMVGKSCGLLRLHGKLRLQENYDNLSANEKRLFLCSDVIMPESILSGGIELPVLSELILERDRETIHMEPANPLWLNANENPLQDIRLVIKNGNNQVPSVEECFLNCALLLYKPNRK